MLATYGLDVLDPAVTPRRIWSLARRLPPGSWPDDTVGASWSTEAHLLAEVIDQVAALIWVTVRAYGGRAARPKPFRRPGGRHSPTERPPAAAAQVEQRVSWAGLAAELAGKPNVQVTVHE